MVLGEATAISFLQDQAKTFNEKFTTHFIKLDGTTATISNQKQARPFYRAALILETSWAPD
jgi:hypothetical protein